MKTIQDQLTAEQKDALKDLLGEPIELKFPLIGSNSNDAGTASQSDKLLTRQVQLQLKLTAAQKKELAELEKEVDAKLDKLLTEDQRKQLSELRSGRSAGTPIQRPPQ